MAIANQYDEIWQGDDFILEFDIAGVESADDLSYSKWGLASNENSTPKLTKESTDGTQIQIDTSNNLVKVILLSTDTIDLPTGTYYFEVEVKDIDGMRTTVATGELQVHPTILK